MNRRTFLPALALVIACTGGPRRTDPQLDGAAILELMHAAYANASVYTDEGQARVGFPWYLWLRAPATAAAWRDTFSTVFTRGKGFRLRYVTARGREYTIADGWPVTEATWSEMRRLAGVTKGASIRTPALLLGRNSIVHLLKNVRRDDDDFVNGARCFVVIGNTDARDTRSEYTLAIDQRTYFIRRSTHEMTGPKLSAKTIIDYVTIATPPQVAAATQ